MQVRVREKPEPFTSQEAAYLSPGQTFLSQEKTYEVHAVSVYDGVVFLLVVDDKMTPVFLPRTLFDVVEVSVPDDWICSAFPTGSVQFLLGPAFVAESLDAYEAMIDQRSGKVEAFWSRFESRGK